MTDAPRHLAQFNIARARYSLDDPRMAEFVENVDRINALANTIPGFVWRLADDSGHAMNMRVYDDPAILPNLTVWENVEALERFVWQTVHRRFYGQREQWFTPLDGPPLVLWWIPQGHRPSMQEGVERLEHLKTYGPSDHAFSWDCLKDAKHWRTARCGTTSEHAA